ncbi:MAG: ArsA family ATPase [Myxococcota bacterium]|nr:ArsA family ATPase [Myxococcota bacterium]
MRDGTPHIRIITGKGGVGKTVVATALAISEARRGKRVLLAEVNAHDRVAALLGAAPVGAEMREVLENLHIVDMNATDGIREYALLTIRFEAIYKAVFENRIVRHFIRFIPSLGEMVMLGKLWYHDNEELHGRPRFDTIIIDAPATGHAISMLRTPSAIEKVVPTGPMRDHARSIREMLTDASRTCMHVVTLPEEMPVNEARELEAASRNKLSIALGTTFINQSIEPLPEGAVSQLKASGAPTLEHAAKTLGIREGKRTAGEDHLSRLPARMMTDSIRLPRLVGPGLGKAQVYALADIIDQQRSGAEL